MPVITTAVYIAIVTLPLEQQTVGMTMISVRSLFSLLSRSLSVRCDRSNRAHVFTLKRGLSFEDGNAPRNMQSNRA